MTTSPTFPPSSTTDIAQPAIAGPIAHTPTAPVTHHALPVWTWVAPLAAWLMIGLGLWLGTSSGWLAIADTLVLAGVVMASVHHAEVVAHRVGEPFGTLVLALAVTIIEVALIITLMLSGGEATTALARDTVFAAVMIILNGMIGLCLLLGGKRHLEQRFGTHAVGAALVTLAAITVLTLVLPNFTSSVPGPRYSPSQLGFIAVISLILYGAFVLVQTVRHRDYFLPTDAASTPQTHHEVPPTNRQALVSLGLLLACLVAVVVLAKTVSPHAEQLVMQWGAPKSVVGILIATVVLMPEGLAAVRAARANRLQTSLNLALGSALASIGLTIPSVAVISLVLDIPLTLGLNAISMVLLALSLFVTVISFSTGRTTMLQGVVHLVLFAVYLFTSIVP